MNTVTKPENRPTQPHYAIVELHSLSHEDGYGGTTSTEYTLYRWTVDKIEWLEEIEKLEHPRLTCNRTRYFAMHVEKMAKVKTTITVE